MNMAKISMNSPLASFGVNSCQAAICMGGGVNILILSGLADISRAVRHSLESSWNRFHGGFFVGRYQVCPKS